jgi:predicted AlkP superfamily pyrophosphatase or phosphodiesterase
MYLPNYKDGSIVNLVNSILVACDVRILYDPLPKLDSTKIAEAENIVLIVLDGIGYEYLQEHGKNTVFEQHLQEKITSVFPSTTAACISSFLTGVAPQQHAITGWFVYLKELGTVAKILPFSPRFGGDQFSQVGISPEKIFSQINVAQRIMKRKTFQITKKSIAYSDYTSILSKGAKTLSYKNLSGFFKKIKKAIKSDKKRKFIYAYWSQFDALCHRHGVQSKQVASHFAELNTGMERFIESIRGTNSILIITADHGIIDTEKSKTIRINNYPKLMETLALPLCGDPRLAYCYLRPNKTKQFEDFIGEYFSHACELRKSEELIENNFFGLSTPSRKLYDRVGDYTLIMKDNYVIKDFLLGEKEKFLIGNHGGVSSTEMFVPLITIET